MFTAPISGYKPPGICNSKVPDSKAATLNLLAGTIPIGMPATGSGANARTEYSHRSVSNRTICKENCLLNAMRSILLEC